MEQEQLTRLYTLLNPLICTNLRRPDCNAGPDQSPTIHRIFNFVFGQALMWMEGNELTVHHGETWSTSPRGPSQTRDHSFPRFLLGFQQIPLQWHTSSTAHLRCVSWQFCRCAISNSWHPEKLLCPTPNHQDPQLKSQPPRPLKLPCKVRSSVTNLPRQERAH